MNTSFPARAAYRAAWLAAVARGFCGLLLETAHNGAWLAALLGSAAAAVMLRLPAVRQGRGRAACALLLAASLCDLVFAARLLTGSAAYLEADPVRTLLPRLLLALSLGWCAARGAGVLYGAMLWLKLLPLAFLPVLLLQLPHYRPDWLFPLMGNGAGELPPVALRTAGRLALPFAAAGLLSDDRQASGAAGARMALFAGIAVAVLTALRLMMAPAMPGVLDASWLNRLDSLLTNGRAPLYLQLPMIALWTLCLMHLAAFDGRTAAVCLQRLFPALDGRLCGFAVGCVVLIGLLIPWDGWFRSGRDLILLPVAAIVVALRPDGEVKAC